jgi:hypothetical protein
MTGFDCIVPASSAMPACSQAASLALVRVFVCETDEHAPTLARYFQGAGHPFVVRGPDALPASVRSCCRRGRVFELFTLPLDLSAIVDVFHRADIRRNLELVLDLSDLPLILVMRNRRPADSLHPEVELRGILDRLPTWRPDGQADSVTPLPLACTQSRARSSLPPSLRPPFTVRTEDDDDALALFSRPNSFVG